jgi:hypothetical protein
MKNNGVLPQRGKPYPRSLSAILRRAGGTFVDITGRAADGRTVRIQTIDTLPDGITPTAREAAAAARIRAVFPRDELRLIPKSR